MDKYEKKLREQLAVEKFIEAERVFTWDPTEFLDKDGNKVDDRLDDIDEI